MTTAPDVRPLADLVWARLDAVANVNAFDGEFVDADGNKIAPSLDPDGRVHAYAVFYPSSGFEHARLLDGEGDSLDWSFQVTCAGGDRTRALWCIDQVRGVLSGHRISVAGQELLIREQGDPGPLRRDDDVSPPRFYLPLEFAVSA